MYLVTIRDLEPENRAITERTRCNSEKARAAIRAAAPRFSAKYRS
jgi:hypothetical protein